MPKDKDLDLNASADLPQGSSAMGATKSAMGAASMSDLQRGYFDADYTHVPFPQADDGTVPDPDGPMDDDSAKTRGFLSRPEGWER
jgi:hypothetical protein